MLVRAQAASNWRAGWSVVDRHPTRTGRIPDMISASIGGFLSEERSFLAAWTAASWVLGSAFWARSTMVSRLAVERLFLQVSSETL